MKRAREKGTVIQVGPAAGAAVLAENAEGIREASQTGNVCFALRFFAGHRHGFKEGGASL